MKIRKKLITTILALVFIFSIVSVVQAADVALVVKNVGSLSEEHEKRIYTVLNNTGHDVFLVDENIHVNYFDFDLIVVAYTSSADIPVNDVPTIAIYHGYLEEWGWVKSSGLSSLTRTDRQNVIIQKAHPLTKGFSVGEKVYVHNIKGTRTIDMIDARTNLNFVATADRNGYLGLIGYGTPDTELYKGNKVSDGSIIVFFGIGYPIYWTDEAEQFFKNSVEWILNDSDEDGVMDFRDLCPDTPIGEVVSEDGCSCWDKINGAVCGSPDSMTNFTVKVGDNLEEPYSGVQTVEFLDGNNTLVEFEFNFSSGILNISGVGIEKNTKSGVGSIVVKGLTLQEGQTKTIWLDRIADGNHVCVKDSEIMNITEITSGCDGEYETLVECDGNPVNGTSNATGVYTCTVLNETSNKYRILGTGLNKYRITGLLHSGAQQQEFCGDTICNSGETCSSCPEDCGSCPTTITAQPSGGGGGGGGGGFIPSYNKEVECTAPSTLNLYKDEEYRFDAIVKNTGDIKLYFVKVNISGIPEDWVKISPDSENIKIDETKTFGISITPDKIGNYDAVLSVFSKKENLYEKNISVRVTEKPKEVFSPSIVVTHLVIPELSAGEDGIIAVGLKNKGNDTAYGSVELTVPSGWSFEPIQQTVTLNVDEEKTPEFIIEIPENAESINLLGVYVSYDVNGEMKTVTETFEVEVKTSGMPTGMFSYMITFITSTAEDVYAMLVTVVSSVGEEVYSTLGNFVSSMSISLPSMGKNIYVVLAPIFILVVSFILYKVVHNRATKPSWYPSISKFGKIASIPYKRRRK